MIITYSMSGNSNIIPNLFTGNIKTIILNTPEGCLSANKIREKLIQEGHQLLPEALYPNEIRISYLEMEIENNQKNMKKYIIMNGAEHYLEGTKSTLCKFTFQKN